MSEPILSASLLISTIMLLTMLFFRGLRTSGAHILLTGSPVSIMPSYLDLTHDFFRPAARQLTPFLRIGDMITIGFPPGLPYYQSFKAHGTVSS